MPNQQRRVRVMRIYKRFYDLIERGEKSIEVRVAYSSMKKIGVGDIIRFTSGKNTSCDRIVTRVSEYTSFQEMMDNEDPEKINPHKNADEQLTEIRKIFPPHKERIGVLVFEFVLPENM